uniref:Uncharacterized protein n=1 Tax=Romanomermis culicivorax TaxID=13658 RepID=A0A915JXD2_ROMCU
MYNKEKGSLMLSKTITANIETNEGSEFRLITQTKISKISKIRRPNPTDRRSAADPDLRDNRRNLKYRLRCEPMERRQIIPQSLVYIFTFLKTYEWNDGRLQCPIP